MIQKLKKSKMNKQDHIVYLKSSIMPTSSKLLNKYHEISENSLNKNQIKLNILKTITKRMDIKGRQVVEAENYNALLSFDQSLVVPGLNNIDYGDDELIKDIQSSLIEIGLFNIAEVIGLINNKADNAFNIHQSLTSLKNGKNAGTPKNNDVLQFEAKLKDWAIEKYQQDCDERASKGLPKRVKKGKADAYDNWLYEMAMTDYDLQSKQNYLVNDLNLDRDGTLYGLPELPLSIEKYRFSKRFFQNCLKK